MTTMQLEHKHREIVSNGAWKSSQRRYLEVVDIENMTEDDVYSLVSEIALYKEYDIASQMDFYVYNHLKMVIETDIIRYIVIPIGDTDSDFIEVVVYVRYKHKGGHATYIRKVYDFTCSDWDGNIWQDYTYERLNETQVAIQLKKDIESCLDLFASEKEDTEYVRWDEAVELLARADYGGRLVTVHLDHKDYIEELLGIRDVDMFIESIFNYASGIGQYEKQLLTADDDYSKYFD